MVLKSSKQVYIYSTLIRIFQNFFLVESLLQSVQLPCVKLNRFLDNRKKGQTDPQESNLVCYIICKYKEGKAKGLMELKWPQVYIA